MNKYQDLMKFFHHVLKQIPYFASVISTCTESGPLKVSRHVFMFRGYFSAVNIMGITAVYEMQSAEKTCFCRRAIGQNPYVRARKITLNHGVRNRRRRPQATSPLHPEVQAKPSPKLTLLYYPWRHAKLEPRNTTIIVGNPPYCVK
ncbi:hypothetical protein BDR06DRAFT_976139 [Suillus hirtellus]|nr:hypothetical protein BDR06DRAFT_976139 [Suillus hirtellus]